MLEQSKQDNFVYIEKICSMKNVREDYRFDGNVFHFFKVAYGK